MEREHVDREAIEREIDQIRSKYVEKILNLLWKERSMYHGDMAVQLSISPSGLNAIMKKLTSAEIPLISAEQIGKFKKYSLSGVMQEYMEATNTGETESKEIRKPMGKGLFLPIQQFVEAAGDSWREYMNLLLCGEEEDVPQEIKETFEVLMQQMEELYQSQSPALKLLQKFIKNEVLLYLLDEYFAGE